MDILLNIFLFFVGCVVLWKASEMVIFGVEKFSNNLRLSSFVTSFLILGILTSITEVSVGINSILNKTPEVFVGNLIGGSFVILLLVIPILAIFNKGGIVLRNNLDQKRLILFLFIILCPSLLVLDGMVSRYDALLLVSLYGLFFYLFQKQHSLLNNITSIETNRKNIKTIAKIVIGFVLVYFSAKILVDKTIFFGNITKIPPFLISLLILSIGTNLPEIIIAIKSIKRKRSEIAFGNYVGSAATNPLMFGIFTFINGPFEINKDTFDYTFLVILFGYFIFFLFARSKERITASEGLILFLIFLFFVLIQTTGMIFAF